MIRHLEWLAGVFRRAAGRKSRHWKCSKKVRCGTCEDIVEEVKIPAELNEST